MHKLTVSLPPFSPDYSGVCSALFELGGMLLIHDASGCTGNYTGYDEPRWYGSRAQVYCTALRELDAVLGNDDKLIDRILEAAEDLNPRFIGLMGSPVPTVIGVDFTGIAKEIETRSGIPSFGFATTGLQLYDVGVSDALIRIAERFVCPSGDRVSGTLNLLGATPLDFGIKNLVPDMRAEFEDMGYRVLSTFAMGSSLDDLSKAASASVNVVISASGYRLAEWFFDRHGIPFVVGQPVGRAQREGLCRLIEEAEFSGESRLPESPCSSEASAFLIGEQVTAMSIGRCLKDDYGIPVHVGCPFMTIPPLRGDGVLSLPSEESVEAVLKDEGYSLVVGDPLYRSLLRRSAVFVDVPHVAVSSKLHWNDPIRLVGDGLDGLLKGVVLE
ncbi:MULTISPECIES: nitrogenase component 1 [Dethiosulfovibrio]|uniref:Nitrogenase component 1 n=2 Tax=Dethiosulfovibrio TaxID=47054 RepID=A0ABS9EN53_9BACT|nr:MULTISPECIES: nitrogenase component 1 [Dethiosulfovibrio]MCF4114197.1 nitrogenase component 1 [Dethiosulfovibrio russensis]MCF4142613.1 nitrogenase component 1 [Dethiosulfovibrio marinus]MCF4145132.1 nitrogenase component 1 [Dethiosulfovibrio acidaminovorans]